MVSRISVDVNTLNEEKNLPFALRSVRPWVDETVVAHTHGDNRTAGITLYFEATVYLCESGVCWSSTRLCRGGARCRDLLR
jgi:hypothetical protein